MNSSRAKTARPIYAIDRIILGYCLLMTAVLLLLGQPAGEHLNELLFYVGMAVLAGLIIRFCDESSGGWSGFLRLMYPAIMMTFFYRVTEGQMLLISDQFFDAELVAFERSLLGYSPTIYIDQKLLNVWVTEIMSLCYFCYYPMLPGFLAFAFLRREFGIIRQYLTAAALTFFVSYLLFWLYPVEGPRWFLADQYANSIDGPVFRQLVELVINNAAVRGGAMPSSHTGVALVTLLFCFRYYRKVAWFLLPIVTGLAMGTIWGRFHYVSDVVVGIALGASAVLLVWKYNDRVESNRPSNRTESLRTDNVS